VQHLDMAFCDIVTVTITSGCSIFFENSIVTQFVKQYPAFFIESEGSLPCSQKPAARLYPEPAESSSSRRSLSP